MSNTLRTRKWSDILTAVPDMRDTFDVSPDSWDDLYTFFAGGDFAVEYEAMDTDGDLNGLRDHVRLLDGIWECISNVEHPQPDWENRMRITGLQLARLALYVLDVPPLQTLPGEAHIPTLDELDAAIFHSGKPKRVEYVNHMTTSSGKTYTIGMTEAIYRGWVEGGHGPFEIFETIEGPTTIAYHFRKVDR